LSFVDDYRGVQSPLRAAFGFSLFFRTRLSRREEGSLASAMMCNEIEISEHFTRFDEVDFETVLSDM
jgi:hypothetical protein